MTESIIQAVGFQRLAALPAPGCYQGDSFAILPTLPSGSVDLLLTDPPYDLNRVEQAYLQAEFKRICKGAVIVFSPPENPWILPADQYLFWVKPISTKNTSKKYSRFVEQIYIYGGTTWNTNRHWSQYTNVFMDLVDDSSQHEYRKPPSLLERLILNHSNPGDMILDPFTGSATVPHVAARLGRECIGIEKDQARAGCWPAWKGKE